MAISVNHGEGTTSGRVELERIDLLGMKVPPLTIVDNISFKTVRHVSKDTGWTERVATVTLRVPLAD